MKNKENMKNVNFDDGYASLSVKDLLEAREAYHVHLSKHRNVVGTAIGRYRIRDEDADSSNPLAKDTRGTGKERRLDNSKVMPWSWPCVLVFVSDWLTNEELKDQPHEAIPESLYMPDGRRIPVCVIRAPKGDLPVRRQIENLSFPDHLYGGGYPILSEVQGQRHIGTIGCLVTDGDSTYALTNRHVTGEIIEAPGYEKGRPIFTYIHGKDELFGISHPKQIGKKPFEDVYRGWSGSHSISTIDAGLIRINDVNKWTTQVYGIREIGEVFDLSTTNISLNLIGLAVIAYGGASGEMKGEIQALFYRYKSISGFDYVADLLIGPRHGENDIMTRPGDSGTIWFVDNDQRDFSGSSNIKNDSDVVQMEEQEGGKKEDGKRVRRLLQPIAMQWGGQRLVVKDDDNNDKGSNEKQLGFALSTFLSTVCRELDVDILRDWNTGYNEYWGETGHYKIANSACSLVSNQNLKKLMQANLEVISFGDDDIINGNIHRNGGTAQFIPLADVPDLVWKLWKSKGEGGC